MSLLLAILLQFRIYKSCFIERVFLVFRLDCDTLLGLHDLIHGLGEKDLPFLSVSDPRFYYKLMGLSLFVTRTIFRLSGSLNFANVGLFLWDTHDLFVFFALISLLQTSLHQSLSEIEEVALVIAKGRV